MNSKVLFEDDLNNIKEYLEIHPEDINILSSNDKTSLMDAVLHERMDVIDCLIQHDCDINFQNNPGWTALHYACCYKNNRDIIERLISNGASGLLKDDLGNTALHYAATSVEDVNIIHQLLIVSDPNSLNNAGMNTFMVSCNIWNKNIRIISALSNITHDINLQNIYGLTAIHYCCYFKHYEAIKLLLSFGADPFIQDNEGRTPYGLANEEGKRIIDEFLASRN